MNTTIIKTFILKLLLKLGTDALYSAVGAIMDELKSRPDSTVDKDADRIKDIIKYNFTKLS